MQNQTQNQTNINLNKLAGISQNEEMENLSFRFYPEEYPDEGDYVMFIPTYEIESGVMGTLPEYNHIEAFIVQTEYSASSVKSFHKLFKIGRIETCLVLSVDKFKGYIDLSRKKANNQEEIEILKSEFKKSKEVQLIMKQVMKKSQMDLETLYNKVVWPLYNGYDHPYDAFSRVRSDDQILQDLHLGNLSKIVHRAILKKIPFKQIRLEAKFELICYTYGGVEDLKKALMKAEKVGNKLNPLNIYLVAPPLYRIELITQNYDFGVELVKKALKKIREQTNQDEWKFKIVSDPIAM
ncbi:eukaryotic translation initiation factor 2 subunit 1 [Anaeramoeba flamelloides]|uniref:Eukaryotic translation initiation factor 2 subunit 1 n=1 Tax=Anaeramoeba flamelloides TaxID=1746091 RepID=A0ABQ8Y5H5_9EUKA|nr:eukaryotic translation initiation factor 2 subunit 1 [Anaeramoeba flamelloides]